MPTPTTQDNTDELDSLLFELQDAVWCSRGDDPAQNEAAKRRVGKALAAIYQYRDQARAEAAREARIDELNRIEDTRGNTEPRFYQYKLYIDKRLATLQSPQKGTAE